jgi:preprotein translocase subunit YajC
MAVQATASAGKRKVNWKETPMLGTPTTVLAASSSSGGSFNPTSLILILVVIIGVYMLMIRPQRRRQQQAQQKQNTVLPGARVRTTAGMYATVIDVDGDDVVLEVAPGVEVRYMRRAIMDVVSPGEETDSYETSQDESYEAGEDGEPAGEQDRDETAAANGHAPAESGSVVKND